MVSVKACRAALLDAGLSPEGSLDSTGGSRHLERAAQQTVSREALVRYGANVQRLTCSLAEFGADVPANFWDVTTPAMAATGQTAYGLVELLARPEYRVYLALLGRSFGHLRAFKCGQAGTAVAAALSILCETAAYVEGGHPLDMTECCTGLRREQKALYLWQQILTGTNREIPYLHRDAYTHGAWARFNVVEMWRYRAGSKVTVDEVWGLSGFANGFILDATNTNQIEHMAISALAQSVLGLPVAALDVLEDLEWMLRKGSYLASQADKRLNQAVARRLLPRFRLDDPAEACAALEVALARGT